MGGEGGQAVSSGVGIVDAGCGVRWVGNGWVTMMRGIAGACRGWADDSSVGYSRVVRNRVR